MHGVGPRLGQKEVRKKKKKRKYSVIMLGKANAAKLKAKADTPRGSYQTLISIAYIYSVFTIL